MRRYAALTLLSLTLCTQVWAAPLCAAPGKDGPTYAANSYYAGSGTASAAGNTITLGTQSSDPNASNAPIAAGDQVFIIQMQDADINNSNSSQYGDGSTGRGYTALNDAGHYEFAVVSSVTGSTVTLRDPLTYSYVNAAATATTTRKSFQIIRVPQLSSLTLTQDIVTPAWNGFTGGVTVLDVAGKLDMNGHTINASEKDFRGGGSYHDPVNYGRTDYADVFTGVSYAPDSQSRPPQVGAMKGEGTAGTPVWVRGETLYSGGVNGTSSGLAAGDLGYPAGFTVARGAPGNAGGGGTQHNAGGGGGGNVGAGGKGGVSCYCDSSRDVGGLGGVGVAASISTLFLGGGGGAGDGNTFYTGVTTGVSSGGAGGGIIYIRAGSVSGTGALISNGQDGQPSRADGAGGGGAGGTVVVNTAPASLALTIQANGGQGGHSNYTNLEIQGPGAGGGGGAVVLSSGVSVSSVTTSGGANGVHTDSQTLSNTASGIPDGAESGSVGGSSSFSPPANSPLPTDCYPQISIVKATTTPKLILPATPKPQAVYTITVGNAAGRGDAVGVTVSDSGLPGAMTYASTSGIALAPATATDGYKPTHYNAVAPTTGTTAPAWSSFRIPGGGSVGITFLADLNDTPPSSTAYQNSAQATYLDPTRTTDTGTLTAGYDSASSENEDVLLIGMPDVKLEKWVRNVSQSGTFGTESTAFPGETLEYCINFREENGSGYDAKNFVLTDTSSDVLNHANVLLSAYGSNLGVRLASNVQLVAGDGQPSGTNLTSDTDTDAAQLSQSAGLTYKIDLLGGKKGVVCFQVKVQ